MDADPLEPSGAARATALADAGWVLPRTSAGAPRWTWLGTVGSDASAAVDAAGMVSPAGWSLDWWVGAEDRWHLPAAEPSVRQTLLGGAPVTETAMRVPGGDAVHRAGAVRAADGRDVVVIEVENRSHVPFAVALAILGRSIWSEPVASARSRSSRLPVASAVTRPTSCGWTGTTPCTCRAGPPAGWRAMEPMATSSTRSRPVRPVRT